MDNDDVDPPASPRRFNVNLLIVHPSLHPDKITAALGLATDFTRRVGDPRQTPGGGRLPGVYRDTRWTHCRRFEVEDQNFASSLSELVDELSQHSGFFRELIDTGGSGELVLQFLGDGYHGDTVSRETLAKLARLGLDFGIECFAVPQRR